MIAIAFKEPMDRANARRIATAGRRSVLNLPGRILVVDLLQLDEIRAAGIPFTVIGAKS